MANLGQPTDRANYIAVDLGASSGRVILGQLSDAGGGPRFRMRELHRFANAPVQVRGHLHWDVLRLWSEIQAGLRHYASEVREPLTGIGIDTWAVDYGLLDRDGHLLGNPWHYRDSRTDGVPARVDAVIPPDRLYARTGIQRLPLNTLYQLASMRMQGVAQLDHAHTLLLIPDLLHSWLTGAVVAEYTNASTTQFLDAARREWATDLLDALGVPGSILPPLVQPGTSLGELLPEVVEAAGLPRGTAVPVVAVATHDTASAVAGTPGLDARSAYISSGTWSLVGIEVEQPILTEQARLLNFTNEGGIGGTIRFLRNVAGLWLLQECQRGWEREGQAPTWPELADLAQAAPAMRSLIDPDAADFLSPADMRAAIQAWCGRTGQPVPDSVGEIARCCFDSLALRYRWVVEALEHLSGRSIDTVRIVGGGGQNRLLCQLTADVTGRRVVAGPVEATALGNVMVQAIATGRLADIPAGRHAVEASVHLATYEPSPSSIHDEAFARFRDLIEHPHQA